MYLDGCIVLRAFEGMCSECSRSDHVTKCSECSRSDHVTKCSETQAVRIGGSLLLCLCSRICLTLAFGSLASLRDCVHLTLVLTFVVRLSLFVSSHFVRLQSFRRSQHDRELGSDYRIGIRWCSLFSLFFLFLLFFLFFLFCLASH